MGVITILDKKDVPMPKPKPISKTNVKKPKPQHKEDLDDYIFKDEPVKTHSDR